MSDEKDALRKRIFNDTTDQIKVAAKAMFDLFTGGHEAVLDSIAEDIEAKQRGEVGAPMRERYRCLRCRGMHFAGFDCDASPSPRAETVPPPETRPARALLSEGTFTTEILCVVCSIDAPAHEERSTFGKMNLRCCQKCGEEQNAVSLAYVIKVRR